MAISILKTGTESIKRPGWFTRAKDDYFTCHVTSNYASSRVAILKVKIAPNASSPSPDSANWSISGNIVTCKELYKGKVINETTWFMVDNIVVTGQVYSV